MNALNFVLLILYAAFALLAAVQRKPPAVASAGRSRNAYRLAVFICFAIGVFLRVWRFGAVPGGFNQDGAMAAVDGNALAAYGTDRFGTWLPCHLTAWGFGQMSSLLSYLIAANVRLFGLSPVTARLPQLLASLGGGVFFFLFVRDSFGPRAGLLAAALAAINPWHLLQSRWALDCNLLPHFFIAALYCLERGMAGKKMALYLSMVFFGLCMYCYGVTVYTVPPLLLVLCVCLIRKKAVTVREALGCAGVYLLIAWPFLLTMAVNAFGWETITLPFVTIQRFPTSVRSGDILFFSPHPGQQLLSNARSLFRVVVLQKKDLPWNDMEGFGTAYLFTLPLALCGLWALFQAKGNGKVLTLSALGAAVFSGLVTNSVNVNRINLIFYFVILLDALGLEWIGSRVRVSRPVFALAFAGMAALMAFTYFGSYADSIRHQFFWGFGEALTAAEEEGCDRIYITSNTQYPGSRNVSEILTLFYDGTDALYFQGKTDVNKGSRFLSYSQRFLYFSDASDVCGDKAAYVLRREEAGAFSEAYVITDYGDYCLALPKE